MVYTSAHASKNDLFLCRILYDRYMSKQMTFQLRDQLIEKVKATSNMCGKTKKWILSNFEDDAKLTTNSQGMRNHIFTFWFKATSLIECMFGHVKKNKALKRGRLNEVLDNVFHFIDIRNSKIAHDLEKLQSKRAFMETNPPKQHVSGRESQDPKQCRGSVGWRWQEQINCMASCTVQHNDGNIVISHEAVAATGRVVEPVTVVHVTSLVGYLWENTPKNVPPTCCCPEYRNGKGVCCGIMTALQQQPQFQDWYRGDWFKKEVLARRHRADLDPFIDIARRLTTMPEDPEQFHPLVDQTKRHRKNEDELVTPSSIIAKITACAKSIGADSTLLEHLDRKVNSLCYEVSLQHTGAKHHNSLIDIIFMSTVYWTTKGSFNVSKDFRAFQEWRTSGPNLTRMNSLPGSTHQNLYQKFKQLMQR